MSKRPAARRRVMVVTGSRSEFGLLRPVMEAVRKNRGLSLQVVVAGEHLLSPANTWREVEAAFGIEARVPMQKMSDKGRANHAAACGRGVEGFARVIKRLKPDWVVVLGDRIEAFAAASAASIAGVAVCHIHGGDRAEGIADEAMRHAITKLSHLHCAATKLSAERIVKMGEPKGLVHVTGSPAIDGLSRVKPLSDEKWAALGSPCAVLLMHPSGIGGNADASVTEAILDFMKDAGHTPAVVLLPNSDPGHEAIVEVIKTCTNTIMLSQASKGRFVPAFTILQHLPRSTFLALLARLAQIKKTPTLGFPAMMFGNSSAGIIEAAALRVRTINVGPRQAGRERGDNVADCAVDPSDLRDWLGGPFLDSVAAALKKSCAGVHPYGDGRAGPRIAALLAKTDPHDPALLRKRITY